MTVRHPARRGEAGVSVRTHNAVGDGVTDDSGAIQAAIDAVSAAGGGTVYFPAGTYECSKALTHTVGNGLVLRGDGRASSIQNSTAGNTIELGDDVTQLNDCRVTGLLIDNSVVGGSCIYARKRPNTRIDNCLISQSGNATSFGIRMEESWASTITNNTIACRGTGIHISDQCHGIWIAGNRLDGVAAFAAVGIDIQGAGHSISGNIIESMEGCGVYAIACKGLDLDGNYFEGNAKTGITFTGDVRTIKADIILNGGTSFALNAGNPNIGVSCKGNYFQPPGADNTDCSIYLIATEGFSEDSNIVNTAYNSAASFIKTKNDSSRYQNFNAVLGNSHVEGANDKYLDYENTNDASETAYHEETLMGMVLHPSFAPRFNAHEEGGFNPETYTTQIAGTPQLTIASTTGRYSGQTLYTVSRDVSGTSETLGGTIAEADFEGFWGDELWLYTCWAKATTNLPGFNLLVHDGTTWFASDGGTALTTSFERRTIVFKPATSSDSKFGMRVIGGTGADVVTITRPIICPLGALGDLSHPIIDGGLSAYTRNTTVVEDRTLLASASATTLNNNNVLAALIADLQTKGIVS